MQITNNAGLSLPLAVWLAADGYDFRPQGRSISVTSLMKPTRQILLKERLEEEDIQTPDLTDLIASRLGHTIHDGIERAWKHHYRESMEKLGHPQSLIDRVEINPKTPSKDAIAVYLEQRHTRKFRGYTISGKFDMILDGVVHDFKSTSTFAWTKGGKDDDYQLQGSLYRWLNPDLVTADHMFIEFVFTDWQGFRAKQDRNYPQQRTVSRRIELMSIEATELWLRKKFDELERFADEPEHLLPRCTDKELWRSDPVWKYYSDPKKAQAGGRATKNFDNAADANLHCLNAKKGVVVEIPGQVKACGYCPVFDSCTQKDEYEHA